MPLEQTDPFSMILWFFMFFVFMFLYPRLMLSQMIFKIEQSARKMEEMSHRANMMTARKVGTSKDVRHAINEFTDFFVVEPSAIDPFGLVRKIDQTIRSMESRFSEFVNEIARGKSYDEKQQLNYGLRAAIGLRQMAKMVRHFVEMAKKFKNLQIAMILQMQLPIIEKIAESEFKGTEAFLNGLPIGDSIGPVVAASLIDSSREIAEDIVMGETNIAGRKCFVLKAKGPAPHLGRVDEAMNKIMSKHKISRIITIDAAQKLEGERSGSVAEGVGFAMGGVGQREIIENVLLPKKVPIDSIVVKVGIEDAIVPMRKDVYGSTKRVNELINRAVSRAKKGQKIIIIGVGNSCGVGDNKKSLIETEKLVNAIDKKYKKDEATKKTGWI